MALHIFVGRGGEGANRVVTGAGPHARDQWEYLAVRGPEPVHEDAVKLLAAGRGHLVKPALLLSGRRIGQLHTKLSGHLQHDLVELLMFGAHLPTDLPDPGVPPPARSDNT